MTTNFESRKSPVSVSLGQTDDPSIEYVFTIRTEIGSRQIKWAVTLQMVVTEEKPIG